jgi:hypothetical protein
LFTCKTEKIAENITEVYTAELNVLTNICTWKLVALFLRVTSGIVHYNDEYRLKAHLVL